MDKSGRHTEHEPADITPWRAGCGESRTSGSAGGLGKRTRRNSGTAPKADPTAIDHPAGQMPTTYSPGLRADPPKWTIWCSPAGCITRCCIAAAGGSRSGTDNRSSFLRCWLTRNKDPATTHCTGIGLRYTHHWRHSPYDSAGETNTPTSTPASRWCCWGIPAQRTRQSRRRPCTLPCRGPSGHQVRPAPGASGQADPRTASRAAS
jgi:hypothetical protein